LNIIPNNSDAPIYLRVLGATPPFYETVTHEPKKNDTWVYFYFRYDVHACSVLPYRLYSRVREIFQRVK